MFSLTIIHAKVKKTNSSELLFFSLTTIHAKVKKPILPFYLPLARERTSESRSFLRVICAMWNAKSLVQDLNSYCHIHFQGR